MQHFHRTVNSVRSTRTSRVGRLAVFAALAGGIAPAVSVSVSSAAPVGPVAAVDDVATAVQDSTLVVAAPGVLANDQILPSEPGAGAYVVCLAAPGFNGDVFAPPPRVLTNAGEGTLTLQLNGAYSFVPATGFTGITTFDYSLANLLEEPECPATGLRARLSITVVATAAGSFDGTFTPVAAPSGPCILVDATTIDFGTVNSGSTTWAAPQAARTSSVSSCSPIDQILSGSVSTAIGGSGGPNPITLQPTVSASPSINEFGYGLTARGAADVRTPTPGAVLTNSALSEVSFLRQQPILLDHYLLAPAAGGTSGTGFRFTVTITAVVRS